MRTPPPDMGVRTSRPLPPGKAADAGGADAASARSVTTGAHHRLLLSMNITTPCREEGCVVGGHAVSGSLVASFTPSFPRNPPRSFLTMPEVETDQAAREASGAHPYGRYLEEFEVGAVYKHWPAKTVTEADDHLFCLITMNHHPLHLNDVYARESQQGRNVVVGPLVYSLALGMSVSDVSGKAIANLATEELSHPAPVFHGDTLYCESEVLEVKESKSKPDRGTVRVHTRVLNQDGVLVAEFKRLVLVPRKQPG
jgi:acyl dehydratase